MRNHSDKEKNRIVESLIKSSNYKVNKDAVESALSGDATAIVNSLDEQSRKKLNETLADKEKTRELLNSDIAKKLIKTLMEGKNG